MSLTTKYEQSATAISEIINDTASHIYKAWSHLLQWDHVSTLSPVMLQTYADTLVMFGAPCKNIIGFIDCTIRKTCQPKVFQGTDYTGYKKHHGFKFQAMALPNGLIMLDTDHRWISNKSIPLHHPPLYFSISQVCSYFRHISNTPLFVPVPPCFTLRPYVPCFTDIRFYATMILSSLA